MALSSSRTVEEEESEVSPSFSNCLFKRFFSFSVGTLKLKKFTLNKVNHEEIRLKLRNLRQFPGF